MEKDFDGQHALRLIEWELTGVHEAEIFTTSEIKKVFESIAAFAKPVVVLTGVNVLNRIDLLTIAAAGASNGFEMVLDPLTNDIPFSLVRDIAHHGVRSVVVRIDASSAAIHDEIHGVGDYDMAQATIEFCRQVGLSFSVSTTITRKNLKELPLILDFVIRSNASGFHPYVLLPEKGKDQKDFLSAKEYETTLAWVGEQRELVPSWFDYKPTCTPQYYRIIRQQRTVHLSQNDIQERNINQLERGCSGGRSFAYISAEGTVQTCSHLQLSAGALRSSNYNFKAVWEESQFFQTIRDPASGSGRCRLCEYRNVCGGCRARAYVLKGDYLGEEPFCDYTPGTDSIKKTDTPAEING